MRAARLLLNRHKVSAKGWFDAKGLKERCRSGNRIDFLRVLNSCTAQIKVKENSGIAEQAMILPQILVIRWGNAQLRHLEPWELAVDGNERTGIRIGQRTQYDRIKRGKCRSGSAQAQREHQNARQP